MNPPTGLGTPVDYLGLHSVPGQQPGAPPPQPSIIPSAPVPSGVLAALQAGGLPGPNGPQAAPGGFPAPGAMAPPPSGFPAAQPAPGAPPPVHPFLAQLHKELGIKKPGRRVVTPVAMFNQRWGLRTFGLDDQIWIWSHLPEDAALEAAAGIVSAPNMLKLQAATIAATLAGIGPLLTQDVEEDIPDPDWDPDKHPAGTDWPTVKAMIARPLPDEQQPPLIPAFLLFPPELPAGYMTTTPADPFDPPKPWRHLVAERVLRVLLDEWDPEISRELYPEQVRVQGEVAIPPLPLHHRSPKATTT